jgi:DNA segregation ATPase FtsK/SpoIIIE-like protein
MLTKPLTNEIITNNGDECSLVLDIFDTIKSLAEKYIEDKKNILKEYDEWVIETDADFSRADIENEEEYKNGLAKLEDGKKNELDGLAEAYKDALETIKITKHQISVARESNLKKAEGEYDGVETDIKNSRRIIEEHHKLYDDADTLISEIKPYRALVGRKRKPREIKVNDYSLLMDRYNPKDESYGIYQDRGFLRERFSGRYHNRCREFYDYLMKEKELYDVEITRLRKSREANEARWKAAATAAEEKYAESVKGQDEQEKEIKEKYKKDCENKTALHDKNINAFKADYEKNKKDLYERHAANAAEAKKNRDAALVSAHGEYERNTLAIAPPAILYDFSEIMEEEGKRAFKDIKNFRPAESEPLNVTVGSALMTNAPFEGDPEIFDFLRDNYAALVSESGFRLPYSIALNETFSLFYKYSESQADSAADHVRTICLNAFLTTPANKMRFYFIDPKRATATFSRFMSFENDEAGGIRIITNGIATDETEIERNLSVIVDYIKSTEKDTFRGQYRNIREYNGKNELFPLPYTILAIMDYPNGFTEKALGYLGQILATGKKCGVYCVVMYNTGELENLRPDIRGRAAAVESGQKRNFELSPEGRYISSENSPAYVEFSINPPLPVDECLEIVPAMKEAIRLAGRVRIDYKHIAPEEDEILASRGDNGLVIPIGMKTGGDVVKIELGQKGSQQVHSLIVGALRSGKSNLLHTIITSALQRYPADDLQIYLLDFKEGVEFAAYGDYNIPNFRVIALESEQEFGVSVLSAIELEQRRRSALFDENNNTRELVTYNRAAIRRNLPRLPRILIIMDEFQVIFSGDGGGIISEARRLLRELIPQGGAFGIHIILATQTMQRGEITANVDAGILSQVQVRIALKCDPADAKAALGEQKAGAIDQIAPNDPGAGIFCSNLNAAQNSESVVFRAAFLDWEEETQYFKGILADIESRYVLDDKTSDTRVLVSDVGRSRGNVFQDFAESLSAKNTSKPGRVHFGESLDLDANHLEAVFEPAARDNLLLIGGDADKAQSLLFFMTADFALQKIKAIENNEPIPRIYVFNLSDGNKNVSIAKDRLRQFCVRFAASGLIDYYGTAAHSGEDLSEQFREAAEHAADCPVWVIISGLGDPRVFARPDLYGVEDEGRAAQNNYAALQELLQNGPKKGAHVIAWHKDLGSFNEQFAGWLDLFRKRIAFNMPGADAEAFARAPANDPGVNDPATANKNVNNAFFYEYNLGTVKFRPYYAPTDAWLNDKFCDRLAKRLR